MAQTGTRPNGAHGVLQLDDDAQRREHQSAVTKHRRRWPFAGPIGILQPAGDGLRPGIAEQTLERTEDLGLHRLLLKGETRNGDRDHDQRALPRSPVFATRVSLLSLSRMIRYGARSLRRL